MNITKIHAHIFIASTGRKGTSHFRYVEPASDSEVAESKNAQDGPDLSEFHFRRRVLATCVAVYAVGEGGCKVKIESSGDFEWLESTDKFNRRGTVRFCDDNCDTDR